MTTLTDFVNDKRIRVIILGDASIGKSCLLDSMVRKPLADTYVATIFQQYNFQGKMEDMMIDFEVHVMPGQEDFQHIRNGLYEKMKSEKLPTLALLCYSCVDFISLHNIKHFWIPELEKYYPSAYLYLVGLKSDLIPILPSDALGEDESMKMAEAYDMLGSCRCSSKAYSDSEYSDGEGGIEDAFSRSITSLLRALPTAKVKRKVSFMRKKKKASLNTFVVRQVHFPPDLLQTSFKEVSMVTSENNSSGGALPFDGLGVHQYAQDLHDNIIPSLAERPNYDSGSD